MKKVVCVFLTILLLCGMSACNDNDVAVSTDEASITSGNQSEQETTEANKPTQSEDKNMEKFQFPLVELYCKVPEECGRKTNGRVAVATGYEEYIATVCCGDVGSYSGDAEGVFAFLAKAYVDGANKYLFSKLEAEELKASNMKEVTVSGYEAINLFGSVTNVDGGINQIYGYTMVIDNRPVMFLGILRSKDQAQEDLNAMKALVDQMAGSIFKR